MIRGFLFVLSIWIVTILVSITFNGCTESTGIGVDFIEEEEFPNSLVKDDFTIEISTTESDTVSTAPPSLGSTYLLGALNDDTFGTSTADIFSQVLLPFDDVTLGDSLRLDSMILSFTYASPTTFYGDTLQPVDISVYELTESMTPFETTTSTRNFAYKPNSIGGKNNVLFAPSDSVALNQVFIASDGTDSLGVITVEPHLRIPLSEELGYRFLAQSGTQNFADNIAFESFFKGFYITTNRDANVIAYFNVLASRSRLILYYSQGQNTGQSIVFGINEFTAVSNYYTHNYEGTPVFDALQASPPDGQEQAYIQSMAGVGMRVAVPNLNDLGNVAINQAELSMFVLPDSYDVFAVPSQLFLEAYNNNTDERLGITLGTPETITDDEGNEMIKYVFTYNFYTQDKLAGEYDDFEERIFVNNQRADASRVIIAGPDYPDPNYRMNFKVLYTEIE